MWVIIGYDADMAKEENRRREQEDKLKDQGYEGEGAPAAPPCRACAANYQHTDTVVSLHA